MLRLKREMPKSNQLDPERLAFIERLRQDGWRHIAGFSVLNFSEIFLHRDLDYAVKVSRRYNPRAQGWRDFATWTIEQQAGRALSPYLPRIWDLEIHERWYSAKMERLQEIDEYLLDDAHSDRIKNQIAEVRRRLQTRDFSISEGDDLDLVDVLQRMATRFNHDWTPYDNDESNPHGWPRDCNFMIRPGDTPQLVLNDPISEELPDNVEKSAFIRRLWDDGWRLTWTWGVYCHADKDFVWKVSNDGFHRPKDGWIAYFEWVRRETAAGRGSPYVPRISELTIANDGNWFSAKIERLQEVCDLSDEAERIRIEAEIVDARRRISERDFCSDNASDLVDVLRRLAEHFRGVWGFDLVDRNFMVRPGPVPQLVITDPIANRRTVPPQPPAKSGLVSLAELFTVGALIMREVGRADRN